MQRDAIRVACRETRLRVRPSECCQTNRGCAAPRIPWQECTEINGLEDAANVVRLRMQLHADATHLPLSFFWLATGPALRSGLRSSLARRA